MEIDSNWKFHILIKLNKKSDELTKSILFCVLFRVIFSISLIFKEINAKFLS